MAEQPEQVLVEQRIAAGGGVEERSSPKLRSKNTMISATVTIGIANSVRNATTSIIHTNTGMRMSVMPGARMFRIVTMKLIADVVDPMPSMMSPTVQKSGPCPGRKPGGRSACS